MSAWQDDDGNVNGEIHRHQRVHDSERREETHHMQSGALEGFSIDRHRLQSRTAVLSIAPVYQSFLSSAASTQWRYLGIVQDYVAKHTLVLEYPRL
jgi:hypothetical protein